MGSYYQRSPDFGNTWSYFFATHQFIVPTQISVYNGRNGYGCNYQDGKFYRIDGDTCYQILEYNTPTHFKLFKFFSDSFEDTYLTFRMNEDNLIATLVSTDLSKK